MRSRWIICFVFLSFQLAAQPFISEIREFKKLDSISFPPKGATLFVGSSSFRLWKTLQNDFPKHRIINRGFGGSSLDDVNRYADQIILAYSPREVVIYCGENDIASGVSADAVLNRFDQLFKSIRATLPKASIVYVSMKPSPSREKFRQEIERGNELIKTYLARYKKTAFVDVFSLMLAPDGTPKEELFLDDKLHMNERGYAIWRKALTPVLSR